MKRQAYYLPFLPAADVNYYHLLLLLDRAEYRAESKAYDTICYSSIKALAAELGMNETTLKRVLSDERYYPFFSIDKKKKEIRLNTHFTKDKGQQFVRITEEEFRALTGAESNSFIIRYFIYVKYYCGYTKSKHTDFTAKQYLDCIGYSSQSNSNFSKLSKANSFLSSKNLIQIQNYRDEHGNKRNIYTVSSLA